MQELWKKASEMGIDLNDAQIGAFQAYMDMLADWNGRMNLTAITEPGEIIRKHFLDSLTLLQFLNDGPVIDAGTGAGFPGAPLAIAAPFLRFTLMDSLNKRLVFLNELIQALGLNNAETAHSRLEDAGRGVHRERYAACVSRAVARLNVLAEYCLPLVAPGGHFYAMKGPGAVNEAVEAGQTIQLLGGHLENIQDVSVGGLRHTIVIVKKVKKTPDGFPRRANKIRS